MTPRARSIVVAAAVAVATAMAAVALAPAALVDDRVARISGGAIRLADTSGSVWHGHGIFAAGTLRLPVDWRIDPWAFARGELRLRVAPGAGAGAPRASLAIDANRVVLDDVEVTLPAALIATLASPRSGRTVAVGGDVGLRIATMEWAPPASRGVALVTWRGATLAPPGGTPPVDLGTLTATLTADNDRLAGPVANAGGAIALGGTLALRPGDALDVSLVLAPRRRDDAMLAQLLSAIGREGADGWHVDWRGSLR